MTQDEPIPCDCTTRIAADGTETTFCSSDQMRRAIKRGTAALSASSETVAATPQAQPVTGWQLVPIEPTYEMCIAEWNVSMSDAHTATGVSATAWAAMLAAAPLPVPQGEPQGWRDALKSLRLGLAAGSRSISNSDFEVEYGGALLDAVEEGLAALAQPAQPAQPAPEQQPTDSTCSRIYPPEFPIMPRSMKDWPAEHLWAHACLTGWRAAAQPAPGAYAKAENLKPLTDKQISDLVSNYYKNRDLHDKSPHSIIRAVEAAHGIGGTDGEAA